MQKPDEPIKQRVAFYVRVSTEEQAEKYGVDLQKAALNGLLLSKPDHWVFAGEPYLYIDDGVSGTVPLDERPAFSRLKEDILNSPPEDRPFDVVAVYKIDRFARQLKILLDILDFFKEYDLKFVSANESIDTSTAFGKAMLSIIGVIAELERDTIIQRTADGRMQAFEKGTVLGNAAQYGYEKDEQKKYKILVPEAEVVREIFRMFLEDSRSADSIALYLREHRILSPAASAIKYKKRKGEARKKNSDYFWNPATVRRLLSDELYMGRIYGNKSRAGKLIDKSERLLSKTIAPMIIDPVTFEKVQRLLTQSKHQRNVAKDGHTYLLSGLLRCNCCYDPNEDRVRIGWHGDRRKVDKKWQHYYHCGRKNRSKTMKLCAALPISAEQLESYMLKYTTELLKNPEATFKYQRKLQSSEKTIENLLRKEAEFVNLLSGIPARKQRLREQNEAGLLTLSGLKSKFGELAEDEKRYRTERAEVQMQISQHTLSRGYIQAIDLFSEKYQKALKSGYEDRNALYTIFHTLIEEIVVYTRPLKKGDIVAGRRKEAQEIPYRLHIKLKLPQDILKKIGMKAVITDEAPIAKGGGGSGQKSIAGARCGNRTRVLSLEN